MAFLTQFFYVVLYQPLFNLLIVFYQYLPGKDFGIAIICLTLFIKILLYPLGVKAIKIQKTLQDLQPKIKEVQEKYKEDKQKQATEMMALYQKEKINPFASLLVSLVQIPILIALWRVFWGGFGPEKMSSVYSFLTAPSSMNPVFLGFLNLNNPSIYLAILAGICQFYQTKTMMPQGPKPKQVKKDASSQVSSIMEKQMLYFFPLFTVFILWKLPAAIGLYWVVTSLFSAIQQYLLLKPKDKNQIALKQTN